MSADNENYNNVSRFFHWGIALLFIGLLSVGFYMVTMDPEPFKFKVYGWHKATGITVLFFVLCRVVWKFISKNPDALSHHKQWEKILSKTIHIVLYGAMIGMPLSGWIMSSAGGYPVSFFGLFEVPNIVSKDKELSRLANQIHGYMGFTILFCIGLHIIGALKHHIFDKDRTLNRMGGHVAFGVIALLFLSIAFYFPAKGFISNLMQSQSIENSVSSSDSE
ncbi:MAG: cytochrome b [Bdellovibrionales bacterium]